MKVTLYDFECLQHRSNQGYSVATCSLGNRPYLLSESLAEVDGIVGVVRVK